MNEIFSRTALLFGEGAVEALSHKTVALFGLGGVGGNAAEALVRAGVGKLLLIDNDTVSPSNLNRQLIALQSTIGMPKTRALAKRLRDINPDVEIVEYPLFYLPETADGVDLVGCDYIIDCIDTTSAKIELVLRAARFRIPLISSMGTGNKTDPTKLQVSDLSKTSTCPLARVMRRELKQRGINHMKVVWSPEPPRTPLGTPVSERGKPIPASTPFVPPVAGILIARTVVCDLIAFEDSVPCIPH
ncbi:MAG: tRNA threonylcarbamoyladenosine dehydratase [Clostridia bacterium]|nr:tRNA threonylcarbamoyladenosine dehydratase [Clostridia bacterium]